MYHPIAWWIAIVSLHEVPSHESVNIVAHPPHATSTGHQKGFPETLDVMT
jgi:hypothetical protein